MSKSEYQELVEFLGVRFTRIDQRFTGVETRLTKIEVFAEENRHHIQLVAEGVAGANQRIDQLGQHMDARFDEFQKLMELSHRDLESSHRSLEASHRDLDRRVTRLERDRQS